MPDNSNAHLAVAVLRLLLAVLPSVTHKQLPVSAIPRRLGRGGPPASRSTDDQ
jgi:hypothetical protein